MNKTKTSIVRKIAASFIVIVLIAFMSIKTSAEKPNCTVTLDDGIYKCYGSSSTCEINDHITCKGTRMVVFHPDTPE